MYIRVQDGIALINCFNTKIINLIAMAKKTDAGAAPVSKYAAKKQGKTVTPKVEAKEVVEPIEETKEIDNTVAQVEQPVKDVPVEEAPKVAHVSAPTKQFNSNKKTVNKKKSSVPETAGNYPEHFVNLAMIIKNNAEIRRFTSIGILNYLLQKKEIRGNNRFVSFKWNKFSVKCDGLTREYSYNEAFFLNCLVAAFTSFSAAAQKTIDTFINKELQVNFDEGLSSEKIENIVNLNQEYVDSNN